MTGITADIESILPDISKAECRNPLKDTVLFTGNITLADIDSIAILKMKLALTRGKYRDYYDLFADSPYFLVGF